jgi:hypothetical protein
LESQHVKLLTSGYLRGWLDFDYKLPSSRTREEIILSHLEDEYIYELLKNRLLMETVLRATLDQRTASTLDPIFEVSKQMIGLKLPSALPKDTIKEEKLSKNDLKEWKEFLDKVNKK